MFLLVTKINISTTNICLDWSNGVITSFSATCARVNARSDEKNQANYVFHLFNLFCEFKIYISCHIFTLQFFSCLVPLFFLNFLICWRLSY